MQMHLSKAKNKMWTGEMDFRDTSPYTYDVSKSLEGLAEICT